MLLGPDGMLRVEVKLLIGESLIGEPGGTRTRDPLLKRPVVNETLCNIEFTGFPVCLSTAKYTEQRVNERVHKEGHGQKYKQLERNVVIRDPEIHLLCFAFRFFNELIDRRSESGLPPRSNVFFPSHE